MIQMTVEGIPEVYRRLDYVRALLAQQAVQGVQAEAERILEQSIPLVPIDTGLLVSTGMVEMQHDGADVRYGGHGLAPYSIIVEFNTEMNHPNGGQSHYLSEPFFAALGDLLERIAANMRA